MKERIAHVVEVDYRLGELRIDGHVFPYAVLRSSIETGGIDDFVGTVTVTLYADEVAVISQHGEARRDRYVSLDTELAWARRQARATVLEGMADVLEWLWSGSGLDDPLSKAAHMVLGLDPKIRKQLTLDTTHSDSPSDEERSSS